MKKVFLSVLVTLISVTLFAGEKPKQGFGIQLGWAQPTIRLNSPDQRYPKDSLVNTTKLHGFKVGLVYDASYWGGFGSSIGVNYTFGAASTPWEKKSQYQIPEYPQVHDHILYNEVEMFVDWQYKFEVAKETSGVLYPMDQIPEGADKLAAFFWADEVRPKSPEDVFRKMPKNIHDY